MHTAHGKCHAAIGLVAAILVTAVLLSNVGNTGGESLRDWLDETFVTASNPHHSMEPRSAMCYWENGKCFVYGSCQSQGFVIPGLATLLGIDPADLRLRNLARPGSTTANWMRLGSIGLGRCIEAVVEGSGWRERRGFGVAGLDGRGTAAGITALVVVLSTAAGILYGAMGG